MRVAFDPGGTTGIAIRLDDGTIQTVATKDVEKVYTIANRRYEVLICEDFIAQHIDNYMRHTIRLVGALTAIAYVNGSPLAIQVPQWRKGFVQRAKQQLGKGHIIHEADALAHLLYWEAINRRTSNTKLQ